MLEPLIDRVIWTIRRLAAGAAERLADAVYIVTWPLERAFAATFGRLFGAAERVGRLEDWLLLLAWLVLWPFRALLRAASWIVVGLPEPIAQFFVRFYEALAALKGGLKWRFVDLAERLNLDRLLQWLLWLTWPLWRPVAAIIGFVYAWLETRPYRQMLWGLPVLALLLPMAVTAAFGVLWGRGSMAANYRLAANEAREAGDLERLHLFERKLEELGVDTRQTAFKSAVALAEDGNLAEAYESIKLLAPADEPGFGPGHLWIIQRLVTGELVDSVEERHRLLGRHLDHLAALKIDGPSIKLVRAAWLAEEGKPLEAAELLKPLVRRLPAAAMQRMSINLALSRIDEAKSDARAVRVHFQDRQRRRQSITAEEYRLWTIVEVLFDDARAQSDVIDAWKRDFPEDKLANAAIAERDRRRVAEQLKVARTNAHELASRIMNAAAVGSDSLPLQREIERLFEERKRSPDAAAAIEELSKSPRAPALVLQLLGTRALVSGEPALASQLLKRAIEKNQQDVVALNNYACSLLALPDSDLNEALDAANKALDIADAPQIRETRGQVLVRLKQWDKAVEDLELAINSLPDSKNIHRSLAHAYAELGQADLANIHREQAEVK